MFFFFPWLFLRVGPRSLTAVTAPKKKERRFLPWSDRDALDAGTNAYSRTIAGTKRRPGLCQSFLPCLVRPERLGGDWRACQRCSSGTREARSWFFSSLDSGGGREEGEKGEGAKPPKRKKKNWEKKKLAFVRGGEIAKREAGPQTTRTNRFALG